MAAKRASCCAGVAPPCGSGSGTAWTALSWQVAAVASRWRPSASRWGSAVAEQRAATRASAGRRRGRVCRGRDPVENLASANHSELRPCRALRGGRVALEGAGEPRERVDLHLEIPHRPALLDELAPQLQPVDRAVFSRLKREPREHDGAGDAGEAGAGHRADRWRPGEEAPSPSSFAD